MNSPSLTRNLDAFTTDAMPPAASQPIRILLFENHAADANVVAEYLELSDLCVLTTVVQRLSEGLSILEKERHDLVLLDLNLPDSLGIETLHTVMQACCDEVIIVLTGEDDESLSLEALQVGAQDYLSKDKLNSEVLSRSIRYSMERASLIRQIEKRKTEIALREGLLQGIFDANSDSMLLLTTDYEIKFLNPAAGNLLEAEPEKLIGETFPFSVKAGDTKELKIPDPNDQTRIVELSAVDLLWEGENARLVILRDITTRRQTELDLKGEKERLSVTLDSITEAVISTNKNGRIERLNSEATRLTGFNQKDAKDRLLRSILKLQWTETGEAIDDPFQGLLSPELAKSPITKGLSLEKPDGELRHITAEICRILDDENREHGYVTVLKDITDQKKAEDELFKAEKLNSIGLLAGGIAHDFNNMLAAILGNISMLRMEMDDNEKHAKKLIAAENAALQAKSLTRQLLTFSKGGAPVLEVTTISGVVEESAQFILRGSNVICCVEEADDLWPIDADKGQISQVINNLIINADQAMPEGGCVKIFLCNENVQESEIPSLVQGDYVRIQVEDEGTGISPENLKRIFDPYFTTKESGNGLGLASSYSIINNHRGTITVESTLGKGSIFSIYLPKSSKPAPVGRKKNETEPEKGPQTEAMHEGKGRILVMDDMEAMMMVAGEILTVLGYEVTYSTNGQEAIDAYKEAKESGNPFDAVVFDLTVPGGMGGEEAANILIDYDPDLLAIASSGYTTSDVMSNYEDSAFRAVVPKPYRIKEMSDALRELLD